MPVCPTVCPSANILVNLCLYRYYTASVYDWDIELSIEIITVHLKVLEVRDGATARTIGEEEMGGVQIVSISEIVCPDAPGPSGYTQWRNKLISRPHPLIHQDQGPVSQRTLWLILNNDILILRYKYWRFLRLCSIFNNKRHDAVFIRFTGEQIVLYRGLWIYDLS